MRHRAGLADIAGRVDGDLHRRPGVALLLQDGGESVMVLASSALMPGTLAPRRVDGDLVDRHGHAVDRAGSGLVGPGDHALVEIEIPRRARQPAHRQGP